MELLGQRGPMYFMFPTHIGKLPSIEIVSICPPVSSLRGNFSVPEGFVLNLYIEISHLKMWNGGGGNFFLEPFVKNMHGEIFLKKIF